MPHFRGPGRALRLNTWTCTAAALVLLALPARTLQDPAPTEAPAGERASLHEEMVRLIGQVELRMKRLQVTLFDASAGAPVPERLDSGLATLVEQASASGRQVCADIDKILELAKRHVHPASGGS